MDLNQVRIYSCNRRALQNSPSVVGDQFLCTSCTTKDLKPPSDFVKENLHVHLHSLVRCKERIEVPEERLGLEDARSTLISSLYNLSALLEGRTSSQIALVEQAIQTLQGAVRGLET